MDRVQPVEVAAPEQAFMPELPPPKYSIEQQNGIVLNLDEFEELSLDNEDDPPIVVVTAAERNKTEHTGSTDLHSVPRIVVSAETEPLQFSELPDFEFLSTMSTFMLTFTSKTTCKVVNPAGLSVFTANYPKPGIFEGWHKEPQDRYVEIVEFQNSALIMHVKYTVPSCQACFEEETTSIDVLDGARHQIANITQKKTWMNSNIAREVIIKPGPNSRTDTYKAEFSWSDLSVNFKAKTRNGLVVANLLKENPGSKKGCDFTLQILKDVTPEDKAVLIAFMLARDLLMIDEKQTEVLVERFTAFIFILMILSFGMYFFIDFR